MYLAPLAGAMICGVLLGLVMANAGGAWSNAGGADETGEVEEQGTDSRDHHAGVVGDPFKDAAGPSMNILTKLMSITSLIIAPLLA